MSAQTRYRTLVHNISRVYSSQDAGRTELLQTGIDEIVTVVSPGSPMQWRTVKSDTERLLRVWSAKEGDSDVARVVAGEIAGLLDDLSAAPAAEPAPAPVTIPDRIAHVMPYPSLVVVDAPAPAPPIILSSPVVFTVTKEDGDDVASLSSDEEEAEAEEEAAASESEEEEAEEEVAEEEAAVSEPEVEVEVEVEVEEEAEEEVVEPEEEEAAEEEEEAGMEVEQVMIRGRTYWKDTNTNKLYAVIRGEDGEDDVGDEVGVLENGKPRFLAK